MSVILKTIFHFYSNYLYISIAVKHCTELKECPENSICTKVEANFKCVCWQGYYQNPNWSAEATETIDKDSVYCTKDVGIKQVTVYNRLPPQKEHLAIAIVLVLLGVIIATLILYCLVVLRPIKHTQAVYRRLQIRRNNHRRLKEFDDVDLTFRDIRSDEELS